MSGLDDHDEEVQYGVTTAFGKKLADAQDDGEEEEDAEEGGSGVAIACPTCSSRHGATASEVSSTVVACGGTVVYVADMVDLGRGEGLFDYLGPAIERLLAFRAMIDDFINRHRHVGGFQHIIEKPLKNRPSTLIVVFDGFHDNADKKEMEKAKEMFESAASLMLNSIIQPVGTKKATKLEDVFDRIEYLTADEKDVDMHLCPAGGRVSAPESPASREPSEIGDVVSEVVNAGLVENLGAMVEISAAAAGRVPVKKACPKLTNPIDLAAARRLGPLSQKALEECMETVHSATGEDGTTLVPEFGSLCDAAIHRALETFDDVATGSRFKKSPVAKRIRSDLVENLYSECGDVYELQVAALKESAFADFRGRLNKLRIGPNLPNQMKDAAEESIKEFAIAVKKLRVPWAKLHGSWMTNADQINALKSRFAEHNAERLKAARASGQFKPLPRKGVTVGLHWLLPKPFGNDYRQEPHLTHTADDLVYAPVDGITDVSGNEIRSGDWRRGIVPAPSGSEMMYLK